MRYAVLADVHGNLSALEAVLERLSKTQVDRYLIAGDLVGYGPCPNECVEVVRELDPVCVSGNHDLIAIGRLADSRCIRLARETLAWTRGVLRDEVRDYLRTLPGRAEVMSGVVMAHGSFDDPQEYVARPDQAVRELNHLRREYPTASILILGHTHRPLAVDEKHGRLSIERGSPIPIGNTRCLLNPGAVGQSRELRARARYMVLDLEERCATFYAIPYDLGSTRRALRQHGLSPKACHLRPSFKRAARRAFRYLARDRASRQPTRVE